jgi:uncharacterized membrane protein YGL010W
MQTLDEQLAHYAAHHTKKSTKITHLIGIPAIILGLMILFSWISIDFFGRYTVAFSWFLVLGSIVYYFMLDKKICIYMGVIFILLNIVTNWCTGATPTTASIITFIILFVGGWAIQFMGHGFEKNKPAFLDGALQILIAPVFILFEVAKMSGFDLQKKDDNNT